MRRTPKLTLTSDTAILLYIAAATTIVHLVVGSYGYFIDELYTLACSRHLSIGFVDIPPVVPVLVALNTLIFGDSLTAIHILPSIFSGAAVVMVGLMTKELGGGRNAVIFAGLCAAFVPVWMVLGTLCTYDFMDQFMIMMLFYLMIRLLKRENPKTWLWIGMVAGLGIMTKPSMVFFIMGIAIGLLLTKHRKQYLTRWPWLGAAIALAIIAPSLIWQISHGFPIAKYWVRYSEYQTVHFNPGEFILIQIIVSNVILLPVWGIGLYSFLFGKEGKKYRMLGLVCCVLFVICQITGAKAYLPTPLYAMLIAGGSVSIERFASEKRLRKILMPAYACVIVLISFIQAPVFMPILPLDNLVKYYSTVGNAFGINTVKFEGYSPQDVLPQYVYARLDWDTLAEDVAAVYETLPEAERETVTISSEHYGGAGAVDLFGSQYGLPNAFSTSLNYYLFSGDNMHSDTWIVIGQSYRLLKRKFGEVNLAKNSVSKYRQPHSISIYICRYPKFDIQKAKTDITELY